MGDNVNRISYLLVTSFCMTHKRNIIKKKKWKMKNYKIDNKINIGRMWIDNFPMASVAMRTIHQSRGRELQQLHLFVSCIHVQRKYMNQQIIDGMYVRHIELYHGYGYLLVFHVIKFSKIQIVSKWQRNIKCFHHLTTQMQLIIYTKTEIIIRHMQKFRLPLILVAFVVRVKFKTEKKKRSCVQLISWTSTILFSTSPLIPFDFLNKLCINEIFMFELPKQRQQPERESKNILVIIIKYNVRCN